MKNTTINNTNATVNNNTTKEEIIMKNNTTTTNTTINTITKEDIAMMTKDILREKLLGFGKKYSNTEFKKTKRAALVEELEKYLNSTEEEPVVEAQKEISMGTYEKLLKTVAKEIINQTLVMKNGKLVIRDYALFYKATKTDSQNYLVVGKRLWGVVSKAITDLYGEKFKTKENIQKTLDKMVEFNLITLVENERNFVLLTPSDLSQDEKDQLNDAWRKKLVTTEKGKDGRVKVSAANEAGKTFLNQMYPCWTYQATAAQMNYMFNLSK